MLDSEFDFVAGKAAKEAIRSLHADSLVDSSTSFMDKVEDDLMAIDRCKRYREAVEIMDMLYPDDEPINDLAEFAMTHKQMFMPMLRAIK